MFTVLSGASENSLDWFLFKCQLNLTSIYVDTSVLYAHGGLKCQFCLTGFVVGCVNVRWGKGLAQERMADPGGFSYVE
jgi:hypothetical protein